MADILNQETIASLRDLGGDFFKELIETFLESSQGQMKLIRRAARELDGPGIEAAAHSLKGACYGQGAKELGELCKAMETKGRENNLTDIESLMREIDESHDQTCKVLKELL